MRKRRDDVGIGDLFKAKENAQLKAKILELESMLTPEMHDLLQLQQRITSQQQLLTDLQAQYASVQQEQSDTLAKFKADLATVQHQLEIARTDLVETNETVLLQSFGLYKPRYEFANSTGYKDALSKVREAQKIKIKNGTAATGANNWTVDGSAAKGQQMFQRLLPGGD
jgi:chromosome segregation ATPase